MSGIPYDRLVVNQHGEAAMEATIEGGRRGLFTLDTTLESPQAHALFVPPAPLGNCEQVVGEATPLDINGAGQLVSTSAVFQVGNRAEQSSRRRARARARARSSGRAG